MDYPKNKEDWWEWAEKYWDDFFYILCKYINVYAVATDDTYQDGALIGCTILEDILRCKREKDKKLGRYFQSAWTMAPDSICIYDNPNWSRFCDMCSEEQVLWEEDKHADTNNAMSNM